MDYSALTSDNSVFDDFSDSEVANQNLLINHEETCEANIDKDIEEEIPKFHDEAEPNEASLVDWKDLISNTKLSTSSESDQPINPKDVQDDDLIMALYLCEKNSQVSREKKIKITEDNMPSTSHNSEETRITDTDCDHDIYSNLNHYINIVAKAEKDEQPVLDNESNKPMTLKDYSTENPYCHTHVKQCDKMEKLTKKLPFEKRKKNIKRLRTNKIKVQKFRKMQGKLSSRFPEKSLMQDTYELFKKQVKQMRLSNRTKRLLSNDNYTNNKRSRKFKRSKTIISVGSTRKVRSATNVRRQCLKPPILKMKKIQTSVHKEYKLRSKCKEAKCKTVKTLKKSRITGKSKRKKKSQISTQQCDPYVKADPDYRPSLRNWPRSGKVFIL